MPKDKGKSEVPDGGWGWMVVLGSTIIHFLVVGIGRCFGVFYLDLLDRFGQGASATAWVVAIYNTFRMAFGPVAGLLCDHLTSRKVVTVAGVVISAGCIVTAFANSLFYTYISFGVFTGIGGSFLFTPSYVIVGKYFDKNKGKAMAISTMGAGLGTIALAPLLQLLFDTYSFFGAMLILGAMLLHNTFAGLLFRPLPKPKAQVQIPLQDMQDGQLLRENTEVVQPMRSFCQVILRQLAVLKNVTFLLYGLQMFCTSITLHCFWSFLPAIAEQYGKDREAGAFLLSVMGGTDIAGRFVWGFFFDLKFVRHRRTLYHTLLGYPVAVIVMLTGLMNTYWAFFGMTIAFGFVEGGFHSQRATIVTEFVAKDQMSSTVGFVIFFQGFGTMAGPVIAARLKDIYNTYNVCYFFGGSALAISSTIFLINYLIQECIKKRNERYNVNTGNFKCSK